MHMQLADSDYRVEQESGELFAGSPYYQSNYNRLDLNLLDLSPERTVKLFTEGWAHGGEIIRNIAEEIRPHLPTPKDLRRMIAYRDSGDELEVERMYSGNLDRMWRTRKRRWAPTDTTVTVASHYCTVSMEPEEAILSGAVGVALAYLLEQYGYRVEILGILTVNPYGDKYRYQKHPQTQVAIAHLKGPHQALQLDYIAAALHPAPTYRFAKRMVTELTHQCEFKHHATQLKCNDSARAFVTDWMKVGGRRVDFASDYVGHELAAVREAKEAVKNLGGRIFEEV
jgi:hypothetical protein